MSIKNIRKKTDIKRESGLQIVLKKDIKEDQMLDPKVIIEVKAGRKEDIKKFLGVQEVEVATNNSSSLKKKGLKIKSRPVLRVAPDQDRKIIRRAEHTKNSRSER